MCFDFHPSKENLYVVGTKEGDVMVCDTQLTSPLISYKAHYISVYKVFVVVVVACFCCCMLLLLLFILSA